MRKLLFAGLLLLPLSAAAFDRGELSEFNDLYKGEKFEEALDGYKRITLKEPANPWGWYNAGNALFRMNRMGEAVYYYAKAFRLDPRNADIRFNLEYAMRQTGQSFIPEGTPRALHFLYYLLSDLEIKALGIGLFWLACLLGAAGFLLDGTATGRNAARAGLAAAGLCVFAGLWLGARQSSPFSNGGVITKEGGVRLLSGPGENFKVAATAPEGLLVTVLDSLDDDYYEIGLPREGIKGWALKSEVEKL